VHKRRLERGQTFVLRKHARRFSTRQSGDRFREQPEAERRKSASPQFLRRFARQDTLCPKLRLGVRDGKGEDWRLRHGVTIETPKAARSPA
jgi:hypothetical protein